MLSDGHPLFMSNKIHHREKQTIYGSPPWVLCTANSSWVGHLESTWSRNTKWRRSKRSTPKARQRSSPETTRTNPCPTKLPSWNPSCSSPNARFATLIEKNHEFYIKAIIHVNHDERRRYSFNFDNKIYSDKVSMSDSLVSLGNKNFNPGLQISLLIFMGVIGR